MNILTVNIVDDSSENEVQDGNSGIRNTCNLFNIVNRKFLSKLSPECSNGQLVNFKGYGLGILW